MRFSRFVALAASASLVEGGTLYRRSATSPVDAGPMPWDGQIEEGQKYWGPIGEQVQQRGVKITDRGTKCHGACGSMMWFNDPEKSRWDDETKNYKPCTDTDLPRLADICFGQCPNELPFAVYGTAIKRAISCGLIPMGWNKKTNKGYESVAWTPATDTSPAKSKYLDAEGNPKPAPAPAPAPAPSPSSSSSPSPTENSAPSRPVREAAPEAEQPKATSSITTTQPSGSPEGTSSPNATGRNPSSGAVLAC
ncbi:hypothetical protein GQ602_002939 [Ophiocordyceps camponoti-floridani]|uniref:Uncharacterized protein n=1 Tax=Ophiocordyceps camponoti-floridani TaxID=2030778 RepID=A0A8H4VDU7_9HYPO|nr:hypothetical protein GQ602_002939 [Ophiocordyceps camponoti-floridani]